MDEKIFGLLEAENFEGLMGIGNDDLLGAIQRNPRRFANNFRKIVKNSGNKGSGAAMPTGALSAMTNGANGSRNEFFSKLNKLDPAIKSGLAGGTLQLVDTEFYFLKATSGLTNIKMIQDADVKDYGVTNMNNGKLEKSEVFLLTGIALVGGVSNMGVTKADGLATAMTVIETNMRNGEFELKANGKTLIPSHSNEVFISHIERFSAVATSSYASAIGENKRVGFFKLANPKLIKSQQIIEFNMNWGTTSTTNYWAKLSLIGSRVFAH